jgi:hypothetical protein
MADTGTCFGDGGVNGWYGLTLLPGIASDYRTGSASTDFQLWSV